MGEDMRQGVSKYSKHVELKDDHFKANGGRTSKEGFRSSALFCPICLEDEVK